MFNFTEKNVSNELCYIRNTEDGGSASLTLNFVGQDVFGKFDWKQVKEELKSGMFEGKIYSVDENSKSMSIQALWTAIQGEKVSKEELRIVIEPNIAKPGFGEMKKADNGIDVYAYPNQILFGPNLQLADCNTEVL